MGHVPPEVEEFLIAGRNPPTRGAPPGQCAGQGAALARGEGKGETLPLDRRGTKG
jgi:2,3-dihydroxyphenylpropionate 1,2-dioxygenase